MSRVFAEQFHDARVRRHATFFKTLRDSLFSSATRHKENPRVVLLTPGRAAPFTSKTFIWPLPRLHACRRERPDGSRQLRLPENSRRSAAGRCRAPSLADLECDPLELRSESMLGVAGLLQAARAGNVVVANALGTASWKLRPLAAFLPELWPPNAW